MTDSDAALRLKYRHYDQNLRSLHNRRRFGPKFMPVQVDNFSHSIWQRDGNIVDAFNNLVEEENGFRAEAPQIIPRNTPLELLPSYLTGRRRRRRPQRRRAEPYSVAAYRPECLEAMAYLICQNYTFEDNKAGKKVYLVNWDAVHRSLKERGFDDINNSDCVRRKAESMGAVQNPAVRWTPHNMNPRQFLELKQLYRNIFVRLEARQDPDPQWVAGHADVVHQVVVPV